MYTRSDSSIGLSVCSDYPVDCQTTLRWFSLLEKAGIVNCSWTLEEWRHLDDAGELTYLRHSLKTDVTQCSIMYEFDPINKHHLIQCMSSKYGVFVAGEHAFSDDKLAEIIHVAFL